MSKKTQLKFQNSKKFYVKIVKFGCFFFFRLGQNRMKLGLWFVGEKHGFPLPPNDPFYYMLNYFLTLLKVFLARLVKQIFGQIIFRTNMQALEKKYCQNGNFCFTYLFWQKMAEIFQKQFWRIFCIIFSQSNFFCRKKKTDTIFFKLIFCKIPPILPLFSHFTFYPHFWLKAVAIVQYNFGRTFPITFTPSTLNFINFTSFFYKILAKNHSLRFTPFFFDRKRAKLFKKHFCEPFE